MIVVRVHPSSKGLAVECAAVHCSRSMGVACWHTGMEAPQSHMLRRGGGKRAGPGEDVEPCAAWGCRATFDVQ